MKEFAGKHVVLVVENCSVPFDKRVWREAVALKEAGMAVSVISPKGYKRDIEQHAEIDGIAIYRYKLPINVYSKSGYIGEYLKAFFVTLWHLTLIHLRKRIHVIHVANPPEIFFPVGWLCKLAGIRFVFDHHDLSPESYAVKFAKTKGFMLRMLRTSEYLTFRTSDHVITTNESLKAIARHRGKVPADRISVVRNGPDSLFRDETGLDPIPRTTFTYIASYIGIMGFTDGVEYIIQAADYIINQEKRPDIQFILIGYGDQFEELQAKVNELCLQPYVRFTNRIPDAEAKQILFSSDVCLAPDPRNNLNEFHTMNKIAEYMSYGKPIVSFDLDESRFTAGEAAVYVRDNDPVAFGMAILKLLDDEEMRRRKGKIGRERLEKMFTWEHSKEHLIDAYRKILFGKT